MTEQAHLQDLSRQLNNANTVVRRLKEILIEVIDDDLAFFETADTRITATLQIEGAKYYLKTGHLIDETLKIKVLNNLVEGDEDEQDRT